MYKTSHKMDAGLFRCNKKFLAYVYENKTKNQILSTTLYLFSGKLL